MVIHFYHTVWSFWVEVNLCRLFEWQWICAGFLSGSESVQAFWVEENLCRLFEWKWICAGFLSGSESVQVFLIVYICIGINDQIIKTERVGIPSTGLIPLHFCDCPKLGCGFLKPYHSFFCDQWLEVRGSGFFLFGIGEIVDHHCLKFLFKIHNIWWL